VPLLSQKTACRPIIGYAIDNGAGTNLKVGAPVPSESWGSPIRREAPKKIFCRAPPVFLALKSTISRFGERFFDGHYSLVSYLFAVLLLTRCPTCPAICKNGGGARAPVPYVQYNTIQYNTIQCSCASLQNMADCALQCQ